MFIGHAAVGFAAKRVAPRASLVILLTAPYLLDMLWPIFLLLGWERVRVAPGITAMTPLDFVSDPWSHSLLMAIVWSLLLGVAYLAVTGYSRGARVVGLLVLSHWVLDAVVHRPDLPLWPGGGPRIGFGLWYSKPGTIVLELAMFMIGLAMYLGVTRARRRVGYISLWSLVVLLLVAYLAGANGPPPPSAHAVALVGLTGWLFLPWAAWIEHTRRSRG